MGLGRSRTTERLMGYAAFFLVVAVLASGCPASARQATPASTPGAAAVELPPPWLQLGPDGVLSARVLTDGDCPPLILDGQNVEMTSRSAPSDEFPVTACEGAIPTAVSSAAVGEQELPLPDDTIQRIAVIGDTGYRLSIEEKHYQACNLPAAWQFAEVARSVAAWQPDLIIHVGDYLYRESPCPQTVSGCAGSPYGDTWATWRADFFAPASPLFSAAPLLLMRGNHETCGRNPKGWFKYLDPRPYEEECETFTEPYVTDVPGLTFAVLDSAAAADQSVPPGEQEEYARQFQLLAGMVPPNAWLITHRPLWGILEGARGEYQVENAVEQAATGGSLKGDYALILSGHIHLAESIAFEPSSGRPPQLISGNAGTTLDDIPTASPTAGELGDSAVTQAETLSSYGFLTLEPEGENWNATYRDATGAPLQACILELSDLVCTPAR